MGWWAIAFFCSLIGLAIGQRKGAALFGFMISFLLGPLGIIWVMAISGNRVQCPFCKEKIRNDASICSHCREKISDPIIADGQKKIWIPFFLICIVIVAALSTPTKPEGPNPSKAVEDSNYPKAEIEDPYPLPKYDVNSYCTNGDQAFDSNRMRTSYCIELQQGAYNQLKDIWYKVPVEAKKHCFARMEQHQEGVIQKNVNYHTYFVLKGCIDNFFQIQQVYELAKPHSFTP